MHSPVSLYNNLKFNNYLRERKKFTNLLYRSEHFNTVFNDALYNRLNAALKVSDSQVQAVIDWWLSYNLKPQRNNDKLYFKKYFASNVVDVLSAKRYVFSLALNSIIKDKSQET